MTVDISGISSVGTIDAETDFQLDYFVPSTTWTNVRAGARPIVVGRKGTGKTALQLALREEARINSQVFTTALAFRDYPWAVHNSIFDSTVAGKWRYQETWLFLVLVELAKLVVGENQALRTEADQVEIVDALRRFLRETWGGLTFDHRDTFRRPRFRVVRTSFAPTALGVSLGSVDWAEVDRATLGDTLSGMNRWMKAALAAVTPTDSEYFLVFDELDLDFESQNETYLDSMIGLVLAAQNVFLWANDEHLPVRPVVLIRDDIYSNLYFPDKNKITTNLVELIQWSAEPTGDNSLKTVIDRRIAGRVDASDGEDAWDLLFESEVMRGRQPKFQHIVQRTYLRPRDIIQFVNLCIAEARTRGAVIDGTRISNRDVTQARTAYSNYLRQELSDEIHAHFSDWEDWLEIIRRIGRLTFTREAFDQECERSSQLVHDMDSVDILTALYRFGVIGFARFGGGGLGGTDEYWAYRDAEITFDPQAPYFKVHLGLKENLDLKEERR